MAEAATPSVGSVENISSPNENFTEEDEAAHCMDKKKSNLDKQEVKRKSEKLKNKTVKILVMGLSGAGKSTLVNAMMGNIVAKAEPGANPCSEDINCYKGEHEGIRIKIYDTAGFGEKGSKELTNERILKKIEKGTSSKGFDLVLIAIRMDCRLTDNAKKMISSLDQKIDPEMWKRSIVILTFANAFLDQLDNDNDNDYTEEDIRVEVEKKTEEFKKAFYEQTKANVEIVMQIPFVLAGKNKQRKLPTDDDWLVTLWDHSILRCRTEAKPFLKRLMIRRLVIELGLMIRRFLPIRSRSEKDATEQHDECPNGVEQSVGANSEEHNGQGVPGQEGQIPSTDDYNGLEQIQNSIENEVDELRDGNPDLRENGLERMNLDLLSELDFPRLND